MVRSLRVDYPGAWHHVMSRGASRRTVFLGDADREAWLQLVGDVASRYGIEVGAYVLMGNHWHLLVHSERPELSRAMQRLIGVYTQRFNKRHGFDGALFRGRFHSVLVDSETYLGRVVSYIHRNPFEAGMVDQLGEYKWSSLPAFLGEVRPPVWLSPRWQRITGIRTRAQIIQQTIRTDVELEAFYGRSRVPPILGDAEFVDSHLRQAVVCSETTGHGLSARALPEPVEIDAAVAAICGVDISEVTTSCRGQRNDARLLAVGIAEELSGLSHSELAIHYGYRSPKGVASAAARYRARLSTDNEFSGLCTLVKERLGLGEV